MSNYLANNDTKAILIAYRAYLDYYKGNSDKAFRNSKNKEMKSKELRKEYAEILGYQGSLNSETEIILLQKNSLQNILK